MMAGRGNLLCIAAIAVLLTPSVVVSQRSVRVKAHVRKDGTYVQPHDRSHPDRNFYNNWSTKPNINPRTGKEGTRVTPPSRYSQFGWPSSSSPQRIDPLWPRAGGLLEPDGNQNNWSTKPNANLGTSTEATRVDPEEQRYYSRANKREIPTSPTGVHGMARAGMPVGTHWPQSMKPLQDTPKRIMEAKARDIDRARFWKLKGYDFNPDHLSVAMMDAKVRDIERARHWKANGHKFDPDHMTASMMDAEVRRIEIASDKRK
jgi:hypothetical protein